MNVKASARHLNVNSSQKIYKGYFCIKTHLLSPLEKNTSEKNFLNHPILHSVSQNNIPIFCQSSFFKESFIIPESCFHGTHQVRAGSKIYNSHQVAQQSAEKRKIFSFWFILSTIETKALKKSHFLFKIFILKFILKRSLT